MECAELAPVFRRHRNAWLHRRLREHWPDRKRQPRKPSGDALHTFRADATTANHSDDSFPMSASQSDPTASTPPLVRMTGITKRFGAVTVLRDVQFEIRPGEVHVLAGENGAGKRTVIKILGGIPTEFGGRVEVDRSGARPQTPLEAN